GLPPSFVLFASTVDLPVLCRETWRAGAPPFEQLALLYPRGPSLAPNQVMLSRSIITYWPHPPHLQAHLDFTHSGLHGLPSLCVPACPPRQCLRAYHLCTISYSPPPAISTLDTRLRPNPATIHRVGICIERGTVDYFRFVLIHLGVRTKAVTTRLP